MKQYIKSYNIFFPNKIFLILPYILFPILALLLILFQKYFVDNSTVLLLIESILIIGWECFVDIYVFGGIAKRDSTKNEYLKTSVRYTKIMKMAFIADAVRRFISIAIIILFSFAVLKVSFDIMIFLLSSVYFFTVLLCIRRFTEDIFINLLISAVVYVVYLIYFSIIFEYGLIAISGIVMTVLSLLLVIFHINFLNLRVKEGYYDR